jgi:lipoprotein-anchoring transpeptidase ErfK/SrfK
MGDGLPSGAAWRRARAHRFAVSLTVLVALAMLLLPQRALAQDWSPPRTVFIPSTGHTSDGLFLDVWRTDGSLLGDPVTEEITPRSGFSAVGDVDVVQYYEHLALVYLPDEAPELQVQALDLGRQALVQAKEAGATVALQRALERRVCAPTESSACLNIVASGHTLRGAFLDYWQAGDAANWLGAPLTESLRAPDGSRVQYFANAILRETADGVQPLPLGKIAAEHARIDTKAIAQPADIPTYDEALFIPPESEPEPASTDTAAAAPDPGVADFGPGPQQGAWKEVVVSLSQERMWAYEEGDMVMSSLVSTGTGETPEVSTPLGDHAIVAKYDVQTMEGTISGQHYRVEDVPYVMYFDDLGNALHGTYWHNNFGTPMSHGCVNLPMDVAAWMYDWAPVGTAVTVIP